MMITTVIKLTPSKPIKIETDDHALIRFLTMSLGKLLGFLPFSFEFPAVLKLSQDLNPMELTTQYANDNYRKSKADNIWPEVV